MQSEERFEVIQYIKVVDASRDDVLDVLRTLSGYLDDGCRSKPEFDRLFYTPLLKSLINGLRSDWFCKMCTSQRTELWDNFFLFGPPDQAFVTIVDAITTSEPSRGLEHLLLTLERFLDIGRIDVLLWSRCQDGGVVDSLRGKEVLLGRLVSVPSLISNKLQSKTPSSFMPTQYFSHLAKSMFSALQKTCQTLRDGKDCSLGFVGQLLGKACAQGHAALLFNVLVPGLRTHTVTDPLWHRVCAKFLKNVPDRWMEATIAGLIKAVNEPETLSSIMGNLVVENQKAKLAITHKPLLQQYHHKDTVLRTLLGYLAIDVKRRPLLFEVLRDLCEAWCNNSAVKHTTVDQQLYVSKALLLCLSLMKPQEIEQHKDILRHCLLSGMKCHLDSSVVRIRRIGMVVGQCISEKMDTPTERLSFTYEPDDETRSLLKMMEPEECDTERKEISEACEDVKVLTTPSHSTSDATSTFANPQSDSDLDSDDELTPFDMSADQVKQNFAAPHYLRDCLDGLVSSEDADRVCMCLQAAEGLIRRHICTTKEVSVEFSKVLLHMEDKYSNPNFLLHRQKAMVALAVTDPIPVTEYLSTEFYSLNYNLRQRLDMLEVLALAAQELSETATENMDRSPVAVIHSLQLNNDPRHWRQVVEERLKSKTRRFVSGLSQPPPKATPKRYAPVAGHFFFPLLRNYDRPQATFDLLGTDHLVLGQLLSTLGLLLHLAAHAPVATQMGKALLDFVWALRFHNDQAVRRGVLMCVCAIFLSMPTRNLLEELGDELLDTRAWLAGVAENDVDEACRTLALQCLVQQERILKKELLPEKPLEITN